MKKFLLIIVSSVGGFLGRLNHDLKGCAKHWTYVKNKRGNFTKRVCHWCGAREDRINGQWKHIGRYLKQ